MSRCNAHRYKPNHPDEVKCDICLKQQLAEAQGLLKKRRIREMKIEAENAKLRELIAQCADDFEAAADGMGVNFYQCAADLRAALLEGKE